MHILLVSADSSQTGLPLQVSLLATELAAQGHQVGVAAPSGWLSEHIGKATFHQLPHRRKGAVKALHALDKKLRADIIHVHGVRALSWAVFAFPAERRHVYTEHLWTTDFRLRNPVRNIIQRMALASFAASFHQVVAVSEASSTFLTREGLKNVVIPGALEPIKALPLLKTPPLVVGTLGSLSHVKGIDILLNACQNLEGVEVIVGGDGPSASSLKAKKQPHTTFMGAVSDKVHFYGLMHVYVQASRSESFGLTVLEAMSAKRPVIVSNAGALPELVEDHTTGLIFPSGSVTALRTAIIELRDNTDLRSELAEGAGHRTKQYTPENLAANYLKLYKYLHG